MIFLGLVASIDPEREGVREAVQKANLASIRVIMITGDYLPTAIAIGKNVSILDEDYEHVDDASSIGSSITSASKLNHATNEAFDCKVLRPEGLNLFSYFYNPS